MKDKILVLDIETVGGFTPSTGFIVEIGIVELNIKTGRVAKVFDSVCKHPDMTAKHHKSWVFENSDLTIEAVRKSPFLSEIQEEVQDIINKYTNGLTAFNIKFDKTYMEGFGFKFPKILPCPMLISAPIMKLPNKNGRGVGKRPTVEEAWKYLFPDKPYVEKHRGCDDARHEAKIVYELIKRGFYQVY